MRTFLRDFGSGGGEPPDLRNFLQGGCSGEPLVWLGGLCDDPQDRAEPWRIPTQGGPLYGSNTAESRHGGAVLVTASGPSNRNDRPNGG